MKVIYSLLSLLVMLFLVSSCQDIENFESLVPSSDVQLDFPYQYDMNWSSDTRSTNMDWKDGAEIYIRFSKTDGMPVLGKATYSSAQDSWKVVANAVLTDSEGQNCNLFYFPTLPADSIRATMSSEGYAQWEINPTQYNELYVNTVQYHLLSDNTIVVAGQLNKISVQRRIRFKGEPGTSIQMILDYNDYGWLCDYISRIQTNKSGYDYYANNDFQTLTVQADGYTPYVYLNGVNSDSVATLAIKVNQNKIYCRSFYDSLLPSQSSTQFVLPSDNNPGGWSYEYQDGGFTYLLNDVDLTASVFQYEGEEKNIEIKSSVFSSRKNYKVTKIHSNAFSNKDIESVKIPNTVWFIGKEAFSSCTKLSSVELPESLARLSNHSFSGCWSLKSIKLPAAIKELPYCSLYGSGFETIEFTGNGLEVIGNYALASNKFKELVLPEGVKRLEGAALVWNSNLEKLDVPSTIQYFLLHDDLPTLKELIIRSTKMPDAGSANDYNLNTYKNCILYVRGSKVQQYKDTAPWNQFAQILPIPGTENETISAGKSIDLGLPSGTLWADRNVGAIDASDDGDYYAWGETSTKTSFYWDNYKFGEYPHLTKYCTNPDYGVVDNITTLESSDDAATSNWGDAWRIPTQEEVDELMKLCTWEFTTLNNRKGFKVTGLNGNSIFLPYAGNSHSGGRYEDTFYLTSTLYVGSCTANYHLHFNYVDNRYIYEFYMHERIDGAAVRPVRAK